jgi:hypothetical protein
MDDVESRLREFRPRRPASIPDERLQLLRGPIWLAVAAVMAAAFLLTGRLHRPALPDALKPTSATLGALTAIALERPDELDGVLTQISRTSLPDVTQPGGALHRIARF